MREWLDGAGIVAVAERPELRHAIRAAREAGDLVAVLRGVFASSERAPLFEVRCAALCHADPDAVLVGRSAAVVHGWRTPGPGEPVHAVSQRIQGPHAGFALSRRRIDPARVTQRRGLRVTHPPLTSLDLARAEGSAALDDALRRGVTLADLWEALRAEPGRRGNRALRLLLEDSCDEPWSPAERVAHRSLRESGVSGWFANHTVVLNDGRLAHLDLALPGVMLAFEIDGYRFHADATAFHRDRERDLELAGLGWQVVRVAAGWVLQDPARFAATVAALAAQRQGAAPPGRGALPSLA